MAFFFISYQSADQEVAERLKYYFKEQLHLSSFLSSDPINGIDIGKRWPHEIYAHIDHAEIVCILVSPNWINSPYCNDEYRLARYFNKRIFTLVLDMNNNIANFLEKEIGYENYLSYTQENSYNAFKILKSSIEKLINNAKHTPFTFTGINPYKGLLTYEEEDAAVFFGRDVERKKMTDTILNMPYKEDKLYILYGSSGTGKSSLLKAGILPHLRHSHQKKWAILPHLVPSSSALYQFANILTEYIEKERKDILATLENSLEPYQAIKDIIIDIEEIHKKKYGVYPTYILIVIDQLEELLNDEVSQNQRFMEILIIFLSHSQVYTVATLRSDFLYEFQNSLLFSAYESQNAIKFEVVNPISKYKIADIIKAPANLPELKGKLEIDDLFVEKVKDDVKVVDDVLPLLSLLLSNLYNKYQGKLKENTYTQGDLAELINNIAEEEIVQWIDDKELMITLKNTFIHHLVRVAENKKVVKVKALHTNFPKEIKAPMEALIKSRLLLSFSENIFESKEKKVEIAHEALIRHWKRLAKWVDEEYDFLNIKKEVEQSFLIWQDENKNIEALLSGMLLKHIMSDRLLEKKFHQTKLNEYVKQSIIHFTTSRDKRRTFIWGSFFAITSMAIFGNVQYFRAKRSEKSLKNEIKKTKHNIGLIFAERANSFLEQKKIGRAQLYANYSLLMMDLREKDLQNKINKMLGIIYCYNNVKTAYIEGRYKKPFSKVVGTDNLEILYISTSSGDILVCDAKSGTRRPLFSNTQEHHGIIYDMKLSLDKQTLITASADKTIRIVKLDTMKIITLPTVHTGAISSVLLMNADTKLISASYDGKIIIWDLDTLDHTQMPCPCHDKPIKALAISKDEKFLFSASYDKTIGVYDIKTMNFLYKLEGHEGKVNRVIAHPIEDNIIFSSSDDGTVREWYIGKKGGNSIKTFSHNGSRIYDIQLSSDGKRLFATSRDNSIILWNLSKNIKEMVLDEHISYSSSIAISKDNATLVNAAWDKTIRYWDMSYFLLKSKLQKSHKGKVTALTHNIKNIFATAGADNTIKIWDSTKRSVIKTLYGHNSNIYDLIFYNKQKKLISASQDQTIRLWNIEDSSTSKIINKHKGRIYSLSLNRTQRYLASGAQDRMVYVYDLEDENRIIFSAKHSSDVFHVYFIDEEILCTTSKNIITIWDISTKNKKPLYIFENHHDKIYDFICDKKRAYGYSCSKDGEIIQWRLHLRSGILEKPIHMKVFEGHTSNVYALAISKDGDRLISASKDNTIRVWDTKSAKVLKILKGHTGRIYHISLLEDDETLISISWDGSIRVWNIRENRDLLQVLNEYPECKLISNNPIQIELYDGKIVQQDEITSNIASLEKQFQISIKDTLEVRKKIPYTKPEWSKYHPFY